MDTHDLPTPDSPPGFDVVQTRENSGLWGILTTPIYVFPWSKPRPDWRDVLRAAALPRPLAQTVADTIRAARLWRNEKIEVTRELCAHFADGLGAGRTANELIVGYGPVKPAAKLIRRAKLRGRPLWWRSLRNMRRGAGIAFLAALAVYAVLAGMFFLAKPKLTRNFAAEINATINAAPADQRAWPIYFEALKSIGMMPIDLMDNLKDADGNVRYSPDGQPLDYWPQKPGDPRWAQALAFVESKQAAAALIRAAAAKPALGFPISDQLPEEYQRFSYERAEQKQSEKFQTSSENPFLVSILLPYLSDFRAMSRFMVVDARRAIELKDGDRFVADIRAIAGMAHHCDEMNGMINKMVELALVAFAASVVSENLFSDALSENNLRDLGHIFSTFDDTTLQATLRGERQFLDDLAQRVYSDDGHGDGHITHQGLKMLLDVGGMQEMPVQGPGAGPSDTVEAAVGPLSIPLVASRKELLEKADRLYSLVEDNGRQPLWKRTRSSAYDELDRLVASPLGRIRYIVLATLMPAFDKAMQSCEITRQLRDGLLAAIAIEAFKRKHGVYPPSLDVLTPGSLPSVPLDRYDGKPIKYRLVGDGSDAHPIIYSIGVDRLDDGGFRPCNPGLETNMFTYHEPGYVASLTAYPASYASFHGDWILYDPAKVSPRLPEPSSGVRVNRPRLRTDSE